MGIAMEQQPPPPALLQPFHLHSWSIYNPWIWASLGKHRWVPALGAAGLRSDPERLCQGHCSSTREQLSPKV